MPYHWPFKTNNIDSEKKKNNHHRRHQSVKFSPLYYDKSLLLLLSSSSKTASMPPNLRANPQQQQQQNDATSRSASASASSLTRKKKSNRRERQRVNSNNNERADLEDYIPPYLQGAGVHFYHGDFCFARSFHPQLVVQCLAEGFLTIACSGGRILLPKLHEQRSVVRLRRHKNDDATSNDNHIDVQQTEQKQQREPLHVPRSIRKKAGKFFLTLNQRFDDVVQGCRTQHGHHCWLYDTLVEAFRVLHQKEGGVVAHIPQQQLDDEGGGGTTILSCPVQVVSVEIWQQQQQQQVSQNNNDDYDDDNDKKRQALPKYQLVAGELGYTVGTMYTSLTGFSAVDSAGSVQLSVTGRVLQAAGFTWWDLGMSMPYKTALGAQELSRHNFVAAVHECRQQTPLVNWMQPYQVAPAQMIPNQHNCRCIIDATAGKIMDCT